MLKTNAEMLETLEGSVERILYSNDENHYTVAQLLPEGKGRQEPVTIVGNLAALNVGETVRAQGAGRRTFERSEVGLTIQWSYRVRFAATVAHLRR